MLVIGGKLVCFQCLKALLYCFPHIWLLLFRYHQQPLEETQTEKNTSSASCPIQLGPSNCTGLMFLLKVGAARELFDFPWLTSRVNDRLCGLC